MTDTINEPDTGAADAADAEHDEHEHHGPTDAFFIKTAVVLAIITAREVAASYVLAALGVAATSRGGARRLTATAIPLAAGLLLATGLDASKLPRVSVDPEGRGEEIVEVLEGSADDTITVRTEGGIDDAGFIHVVSHQPDLAVGDEVRLALTAGEPVAAAPELDDAYVPVGATRFRIADASALSVGDAVLVADKVMIELDLQLLAAE